MIRYPVIVKPQGSLYVGGYAEAVGAANGDTAQDAQGLLLPASTVKGALREAAVRLVQGAGHGHDLLVRLFGAEGGIGEGGSSEGGLGDEGLLRLAELRPTPTEVGTDAAKIEPVLRHHVSLLRETRQAAPGRLFQTRVTPAGQGLAFAGGLTSPCRLEPDEEHLLRAAVRITDQLGGGRGRGLGWVSVELGEGKEVEVAAHTISLPEESVDAGTEAEPIHTLVLELRALQPLRLGVIKDRTNVLESKDYLDGSAVRGAVAAVLHYDGEAEVLEQVMGGARPAWFGNGYAGGADALPAPLTLRKAKARGPLQDDAVHLCTVAMGVEDYHRVPDYRGARGTYRRTNDGAWIPVQLQRRVVSRAARNLIDGKAAAGQLYSTEIVEPWLRGATESALRFFVPVRGSAEQLRWIVRAAAEGLSVGGARTRGFGAMELAAVHTKTSLDPLAERHRRWVEHLASRGEARRGEASRRKAVPAAESTGVLLATGPLALDARRLTHALDELDLELVHGASRRAAQGGWNRKLALPRGVVRTFVPGSTFVVRRRDGGSALDALATLERDGLGPGRPDGWGHLVACHPIHLDHAAPPLSSEEGQPTEGRQDKGEPS